MKNRNDVIKENIGLVYSCAKKFQNKGIDFDDIIQTGCIGLIKATDKFDESRGVKFSTYAVYVIIGEIRQLFRDNSSIKISRKFKDLYIKISRENDIFFNHKGRYPTINELSEILHTDKNELLEALEVCQTPKSLTLFNNENESEQQNVAVDFDYEKISNKIFLSEIIKNWSDIDKKIIYFRFFKGITQSKIASILGITQVKVSRREKALLSLIKQQMK